MALSAPAASRLKPHLDALLAQVDVQARRRADPVELVHRYPDPVDAQVVGLLACSLAYGRVGLFLPKLEGLLAQMGEHPADFFASFDPARDARVFAGFVYRFNLGGDLGLFTAGVGALLRKHGTLEAAFAASRAAAGPDAGLSEWLSGFVGQIRSHPQAAVVKALGPIRGLDHLLPEPTRGGASKRLMLYLRWMARPADGVDLGLWKTALSPSELVIPLDTHIGRIGKHLGLTARTDLSWRTAEDITASLRRIDPLDPVKYDFVLCHHGMSGACPSALDRKRHCGACALQPACRTGRPIRPRSSGTFP